MIAVMEAKRFNEIFKNEFHARRFFEKHIWKGSWKRCVFCRMTRPYLLTSGRWRCRGCRRDFRSFNGRWLERVRIRAHQWCGVLKHFQEEILPFPASERLKLSYPTVLKAYHTIRWSLLPREKTALYPVSERRALEGGSIFGLIQQGGKIHFEGVAKWTPRTLARKKVKMHRFGNVIYAEKFLHHDATIFWGDRSFKIKDSSHPEGAEKKIDESENFRSFARFRFKRYHGISKKLFPLYLGEMVFRFNHRGENLFHLLAARVSQSVAEN
jgi:transposase